MTGVNNNGECQNYINQIAYINEHVQKKKCITGSICQPIFSHLSMI